ncbi:RND family transporter [Mycobacterium sp. 663a-19]|uniref:MMPL/RND family transporter n=1 Tax=Mycobacterium sp. 663a-19 TaxID=2986148 RepID=UPI002D1EFCC6|nr:RND family transporter [Mycobacterium sp. 663a-19]MEB3983897.1 RND family transporter [Mycobacterium sp. 663a-19]
MSEQDLDTVHTPPSFAARMIHRFSIPIILAWVAFIVILGIAVPSLEQVERTHSIALNLNDAPAMKASMRMGQDFKEADSGTGSTTSSTVMIVLEGQQPLGDEAHKYYDRLIHQLRNDPKHVGYIQDFWSDPLLTGAAQSGDGKAAYVQISTYGAPGSALSNESVEAVRYITAHTPAPPGVRAYVTGPGAFVSDMGSSGDRTVVMITLVSLAVIFTMLLLVYRSIVTVILLLLMVGIELQVARGLVAFLGDQGLIGLSTFAVNLLVALVIAAGTDYGIFFVGRYQEARQGGESREVAYYTTYHGVAKIVLASGVTIAGALFCLKFARLPQFQSLAVPSAVGVLVAVAVALTLVPAVLHVGSRFGLFDPKRRIRLHGWRRIGTAIVRWPAPILIVTLAVTLIGLLTLPGYKPSYNDMNYIPKNIPASVGLEAAKRHFAVARMLSPEVLLIEADHDLRNPADALVLNKLEKSILAVPGIARVQGLTHPEGTPLKHTSIPFMLSMQQAASQQIMPFQRARMDDLLRQANELAQTINIMEHMYDLMQQLVAVTHHTVTETHDIQQITSELRDHLADFEDFFRPIRSYFYWEKHCYDIPLCFSLRSIFDSLDGVDELNDKLKDMIVDLDHIDALMPQILVQFPPMIAIMKSMHTSLLTMHSTMAGTMTAMDESSANSTAMGKAFDESRNDDSFFIGPDAFNDADFKRVMKLFLSPDGKAARLLITQKADPASPEGVGRVDAIKNAAAEALKGTPLEGAKVYLAGTAALTKDLVDGSKYDLMIAGVAAVCLIFIIMLIMTRSFVAALVIVGTVLLSLGASFGLSVLVWQNLLGIQIHWLVLVMAVLVLLAVGSDYNLLLVARMQEEVGAGIKTGIIRAMGGTGKVVTNAGLVFAFTMGSMIVSDLIIIGQIGTTIGLGLLFDTLIVRAFMTPSVAALLGRWFWWPKNVRSRPASLLLRPTGPRPLVRALLKQPR